MPEMKISFLDVGHGDFVYAETPLGNNLVIDLGCGDIVPSKFLSKISNISELQISHPHTDHFDDLIQFSKKTIKSFRCPSLTKFKDEKIGWKKADKVKISKLKEFSQSLKADNSAVVVDRNFTHTVWFPENIDENDPNTSSLVTTLSYCGVKILFGGDLPASGWKSLLQKENFRKAIQGTTIFKVPHHGRQEGCCEELFGYIAPKLCLISDKSLEKDNKNTAATDWYTKRSSGCKLSDGSERKVLTTRNDKSIFIKVNSEGTWWVYKNTTWEN